MALNDKNIVITPNIGASEDPKIVFSGADASTGPQNITLKAYPTNSGTLSFEGSAGQLFSITNSMSGTIYSVNDVSGIPSIEVLDTGLIKLGQYSGNVLLGTGTDNGADKLQVNGSILGTTIKGNTLTSSVATGTAPLTVSSTTVVTNLNADLLDGNHASAFATAGHTHDYVPERNRSDWNDSTVIGNVIGQIAWKNYGNGHTIFDASNGTSPDGGAINNTNPAVNWSGTYPTLMGWNGSSTYGVRVDVCRYADSAGNGGVTSVNGQTGAVNISGGATITDDTTTNATRYIVWEDVTSGSSSSIGVSSSKLYFNPSTGTLSATIFNSLSDANLKENVKPVVNSNSILKQIDGVEFTWKDNGKKSYGVIAQEIEKILPDVVDTSDQGVKSVNYAAMTAFLIEAVKELSAEIEQLKQNK